MYKYLFGFLGCGNMASAIAESFLAAGKVKPDEILLCDKEISKTETFAKRGCGTTSVPSDITENCRFVFCAVKPQSFSSLCEELSGKINCEVIISIMAGIKIENIEKALGVKDVSVVRIMPNLACRFGCGVTLVEFNGLNEASKSVLKNALLSMGQLVEIPEKEFNFANTIRNVLKKYQDNILRVSFLGSISEYKGIRLLVNAWLNSDILQGDKFELTVAGRGDIPYLESLRKIKNVIIDNRFISNEEMLKYYSETDITIMPYINISQSGVLLTNIGLHIPVIVSKVGGLTQPFEIKKIGYILPDISEKSIISTLVLAQKELKQLRELKGNTKEWEELDKFYDWKNIAVKTVNFYLSISKRCRLCGACECLPVSTA